MNSLVKIVPNVKKYKAYIEDLKNGVSPIMISGLTDSGKMHFAYSSYFYQEKPICIVTYNDLQARRIINDLLQVLIKDLKIINNRNNGYCQGIILSENEIEQTNIYNLFYLDVKQQE